MFDFLKRPIGRVIVVAGTVGVLAAAWYLGSPLFLDEEVDEAFPLAASAEIPDDMTIEEVEAEMEEAADAEPKVMDDDMPETGEPVAVLSGGFFGADAAHQGSGVATIYELADGSHVLRFEDFDVTNGPDLHVLLSTSADPLDDLAEYVDLGELKGNIGNQNYELPADVDPADYQSIVIYCQPFHVVFAAAQLGA